MLVPLADRPDGIPDLRLDHGPHPKNPVLDQALIPIEGDTLKLGVIDASSGVLMVIEDDPPNGHET